MPPRQSFKYLILLAMLYITADAASNIMAYKFISMGPLLESGASFIFPFTYFFGDIIAEVYGYQRARQIIWYELFCTFVFATLITIILRMPGAVFWNEQASYDVVLHDLLRVTTASAIGTVCGGFANAITISRMKVLSGGRHFWLRSFSSTAVGEAVFIFIVGMLAFTGFTSIDNVVRFMVSDYLLKIMFAVVLVVPATILQAILKRAEGVDVYDTDTNYNPFSLRVDEEN